MECFFLIYIAKGCPSSSVFFGNRPKELLQSQGLKDVSHVIVGFKSCSLSLHLLGLGAIHMPSFRKFLIKDLQEPGHHFGPPGTSFISNRSLSSA